MAINKNLLVLTKKSDGSIIRINESAVLYAYGLNANADSAVFYLSNGEQVKAIVEETLDQIKDLSQKLILVTRNAVSTLLNNERIIRIYPVQSTSKIEYKLGNKKKELIRVSESVTALSALIEVLGADAPAIVKSAVNYIALTDIADFTDISDIEDQLDPVSAAPPSLVPGDSVLVPSQTDASENGLYIVNEAGDELIRRSDADGEGELKGGDAVYVLTGDTYGDTYWAIISPDDVVDIGTDDQIWRQLPGFDPKAFITLVDGATVTWDYSLGYNAKVTLGGNRTLAITNAKDGDYGTLIITQGTGGGHELALPAGSKVVNDGAGLITLSAVEGDEDIITWVKEGSIFRFNLGPNYTAA